MTEAVQGWTLSVRGDSMRFLLKAGDLIRVRRAPLSELRCGDMVVVLDWRPGPAEYVVHRLLGRWRRPGGLHAVTKGDANLLPDPLSPESAVVGVVDAVLAQGTWRALGPSARLRGLLISVLGAPFYRGVFEADRLGWTRMPKAARGILMRLLPAYMRLIQGVYARLQTLCRRLVLGEALAPPVEMLGARPLFGIIEDQTWSGRTEISGDVFVPSGVTLRIEPGARIVFSAESCWDCSGEMRLCGERPKIAEGKCRLVVAGRVLAEGAKEAPITFGGEADWGGIHFVTDSWGSVLAHVALRRSVDAAVALLDSAHAALRCAVISDCGDGVVVRGPGAKAELDDCRIERCARRGISVAAGALTARRAVVSDCGEVGVFAADAALEIRDGTLSGAPVGLSQSGGTARLVCVNVTGAKTAGFELDRGEYEATDCVMTDCGDGLRSGGGMLRLLNFETRNCGCAIRAEDSSVSLRDARLTGGESGVLSERGDIRLSGCALAGQSGPAAFQNGGALAISDSAITGPGTGTRVAQGRLVLRGVRFDGPNLLIECTGAAVLENVRHVSESGGARFGGASVDFFRVDVAGSAGVEITDGRLRWRSGGASRKGLRLLSAAAAELRDVVIRDAVGHGVELIGGRLTASGCRFENIAEAGVHVSEEGRVALTRCSFRRVRYGIGVVAGGARLDDVHIADASAVGFTAASGRHELKRVTFHGCADRIHAEAGARVEVAAPPDAFAATSRALRAVVLRTNRLPGLRSAYRVFYWLPVGALRLWAALDKNIDGLYAHRSWARRDWEPGVSDIDLLVSARDLAGEKGRAWLEKFWTRFGLLKSVFPFLGECLVVEPAELAGHAVWGGFRARAAGADVLPLSGEAIESGRRPPSLKARLEPLGELAHAYTRLMSSALWRPDASRAGRLTARNAALDVARVRAAKDAQGPGQLASREAMLAAVSGSGDEFRRPLEALNGGDSVRARAQLCAAGLSSLHQASLGVLADWPSDGASKLRRFAPQAARSAAADVELRRRRQLAGEYAAACGGALVAGCGDDLYRTCLVIEDAAANPEILSGLFEGLIRLVSVRGEPATLPIVLTESGWKVWSRLAYLESPTRFLDPGDGAGDFLGAAGALFPGSWLYAWGREKLSPVESADALVLDLARESLATFRCAWRWQCGEKSPLSRGYIQHYLLGRAMGLRLLLERGLAASFFDLDALRGIYVREFPERAAELERLWARLSRSDGPAPWGELYVWADAELRGY